MNTYQYIIVVVLPFLSSFFTTYNTVLLYFPPLLFLSFLLYNKTRQKVVVSLSEAAASRVHHKHDGNEKKNCRVLTVRNNVR